MDKIISFARNIFVAFSTGMVAWFTFVIATRPEPVFPQQFVDDLIKKSSIVKKGKESIVIITGSTGGIGLNLAEELYKLGLTVILASRTESKCKQVIEEIKSKYPSATGALDYGVLDTGDLTTVKSFCDWYKSKYAYLTVLVNNAGQHYMQGETPKIGSLFESKTTITKQGYDEIFAINYLGHFLLTHLLTPLLQNTENSRIINVASAYHYGSDGTTLRISNQEKGPDAANGQNRNRQHRQRAYAVTKLAQVYHARSLYQQFQQEKCNIKIISLCPGWVRTGMIPHGMIGHFLNSFNFLPKCGILTPLCTIIDPDLKSGEFCANYIVPIMTRPFGPLILKLVDLLGIRLLFTDILAMFLVLLEARSYGYHKYKSSPDSYNQKIADDLHQWSLKELTNKGFISK
jgi:NAD(P)-dependent dehydrogenase (short-subunit alcohol dehydrogenase family)